MWLEAGPIRMEGSASPYFPPRVPECTHAGELETARSHLIAPYKIRSLVSAAWNGPP